MYLPIEYYESENRNIQCCCTLMSCCEALCTCCDLGDLASLPIGRMSADSSRVGLLGCIAGYCVT